MENENKIASLLEALKSERDKFTSCNEATMKSLCDELIAIGHYPEKSKLGSPALQMVENYGVDWNTWSEPHSCRHCNADLRDLVNGAPFKLEIAHVNQDTDRTIAIVCRFCNKNITLLR